MQSLKNLGRENQFKKYTNLEIESYKKRLASSILTNMAIDCEYLIKDSSAKEYISKYTEEVILKPDMKNKIMGITFKLVNMKLKHYSDDGEKSEMLYPVINKYKGYDLIETLFFRLDSNGTIDTQTVPMIEKKIIL